MRFDALPFSWRDGAQESGVRSEMRGAFRSRPTIRRAAARAARSSRGERRAAGTCYRICGKSRQDVFVSRRGRINNSNGQPMKDNGRRSDDRVMRAGETEDAMTAAGVKRRVGQGRCALSSVQTKREARRVHPGLRGRRESAQCNQQALRKNRIGDNHADQGSAEPSACDAQLICPAHNQAITT